jgi:hypothetical protein
MKNTDYKEIFAKNEKARAEARRKLEAGELITEEDAFLLGREMVFHHGCCIGTEGFPTIFQYVPHLDWMAPCCRVNQIDRINHRRLCEGVMTVSAGIAGLWM